MKNIYFFSFIILLVTTTGCGTASVSEKEMSSNSVVTASRQMNEVVDPKINPVKLPDSSTIHPSPSNTINLPVAPDISSAAGLNPAHGQPGHRCEIPVGASMNSKPAIPISNSTVQVVPGTTSAVNNQSTISKPVTTGINPEHGKPGHRCDIAVGEALNSKSTTTVTNTNSPSTATPTQPLVKPSSSSATVATGLNPEHGKPGHRCDIAVGAALTSKPTTTVTNTNSPSAVIPTPPVIKPYSPSATVATGLNPEHGKPGHRCDIAVGAALNSKPTTSTTNTTPQLDTGSKTAVIKQ